MNSEIIDHQLLSSLKTGFLDRAILSDKEFQPELLVNERSTGKKIFSVIIKELLNCQAFWFSVAFATKGGVATLIETLKYLDLTEFDFEEIVNKHRNNEIWKQLNNSWILINSI